MLKPTEYRRRAEECRRMAGRTLSDGDRTRLLDMAEAWMSLAVSREELLERHPELGAQMGADAGAPAYDGQMKSGQAPARARGT